MAAMALGLLGAAGGIFWPGFNAMIGAVVPSDIRQRYFGINFTLVNLGIGIGGLLAGSIVDVHRPGTFVAIYLGNALSFLAPVAVLLGPLRHVSGKVAHPVSDQDGEPIRTSYLDILRDKAMVPVIALTFLSAFVGYAQSQAGFTAYARLVGGVSTRTIGYAFAANTAAIVLLQLLVLQRIEGRRRTRVILVLSALWAVSWLMTGLSGLLPGTPMAAALVIGGFVVFALGETLLQPTIPAITNDLSPDHLRGRYNAVMAGAFQLAAVTGPVVAGVMLGARLNVEFIGMLDPWLRSDGLYRLGGRAQDPRPGQWHQDCGGGAQPGVIPHGAANSCPGSRTSRPSPELKASGGQVIGSTAMPLERRAAIGSESPVKTCNHGYALASAQTVTVREL